MSVLRSGVRIRTKLYAALVKAKIQLTVSRPLMMQLPEQPHAFLPAEALLDQACVFAG
ncbi:MAG: hypothetical protein M3Z54_12965 [Gemmatimonadota bacterium]|nr:hypothetical protein [Gemmatimonadota bacterium]